MVYENQSGAYGVEAHDLGKRYGELWALRELELAVPTGSVLGLLGHNGAGKTTAIRILTTLTAPTTGTARVAGVNVVAQPAAARSLIGLAGQSATVDGLLTGRANLEMIGRLYHLPKRAARDRAAELLERFDLVEPADRIAKTYSGGMRRRLDLAASLVASPPVLFLDEPTTGLDPRSRNELWELLEQLVRDGATVILTTQYLDEADRLADSIVVLDHGRIAAAGTPAELKARVGGERVELTLSDPADAARAIEALAPHAEGRPSTDEEGLTLTVPLRPGTRLIELVRELDAAGIDVLDIHRREATLDDVFLTITSASTKEQS